MLRRSLPILAMSRASVDHSTKGSRTPGGLLGMSRRSEPDRSYENRSGFDRPRRINDPGATGKSLTWISSIGEREPPIGARSRIVAYPIRPRRHETTDDWPSTSAHRWRSPMLHTLMLAAVVGFFGLCVIYSYPLTGTVVLGILICYTVARTRRF
jgi:hypothetical protein